MGRVIRFKRSEERNEGQDFKLPVGSAFMFILMFSGSFYVVRNIDSLPLKSVFDLFKSSATQANTSTHRAISFAKCGSGPRINCVVDGDTFYLDGHSIRVADIDTPETYRSRCSYEANLGARATRRFTQLLNAGPFVVKPIPFRDEDRYGRKLRTVHRNNQSLGAILVSEGLARVWEGRRRSWCN
jgi:endonuclease YncB( thermonuclease family)